jgi:hypothetical protein
LLGEYMEGTCGGSMSCCTCHVYLKRIYKWRFLPRWWIFGRNGSAGLGFSTRYEY